MYMYYRSVSLAHDIPRYSHDVLILVALIHPPNFSSHFPELMASNSHEGSWGSPNLHVTTLAAQDIIEDGEERLEVQMHFEERHRTLRIAEGWLAAEDTKSGPIESRGKGG